MTEHRLLRFDKRHPPPMFGSSPPREKQEKRFGRPKPKGRTTAAPAKNAGGLNGTAYGCSCGGCLFGAPAYPQAVVQHRAHIEQVHAEEAKQAEADKALRGEAWL